MPDAEFEKTFSDLAFARLRDKAPGLLDHLVGFQLLDKSEDNTHAVGVWGFKVGDEWLVYFDHYHRPHYYGAVRTRDFKTWTDVSKQMAFPRGHRHGTALAISQDILQALTKHASAGD